MKEGYTSQNVSANSSSKSATATLLAVVGSLWCMFGWVVPVVLLFAWVSGTGVVAIPKRHHDVVDLVGVPGDTIRLKLFEGKSRSGAWGSSDGFYLKLQEQEPAQEIVIPVLSPTEIKGLSDVIL